MKKKDIHLKIVRLTTDKEWVKCPVTLAQVQELSKLLFDIRKSPINYKEIGGIEVVWNDQKRIYETLEDCSKEENLVQGTIKQYIRTGEDSALFNYRIDGYDKMFFS